MKNIVHITLVRFNPVHLVADGLHRANVLRHKHSRYIVGASFMAVGSSLAKTVSVLHLPHSVDIGIDMLAYGIHGLGSTPFLLALSRKFKLEETKLEETNNE